MVSMGDTETCETQPEIYSKQLETRSLKNFGGKTQPITWLRGLVTVEGVLIADYPRSAINAFLWSNFLHFACMKTPNSILSGVYSHSNRICI